MHLWEIDHPYYGAEGEFTEFETLDDLIEHTNAYNADLNHVYRWDWIEDDEGDTLTLFVVLPRKSRLLSWSAPVAQEDEEKVREFLTSDRVLGALRAMWEPLLSAGEA